MLTVLLAFRPHDPARGVAPGWTFANWAKLGESRLLPILERTVAVSLMATVICLILAVPVGLGMARAPARWRPWLLLGVVIPFWTNFVLRVFAWRMLLHPEGALTKALIHPLRFLHLLGPQEGLSLLNNTPAVVLVSVYTYLPFAILPVYAAAEKFDFGLLDAARDLGATGWQAFGRIFLPGIRAALVSAFLITFVPLLGSYVIPDLVGGPDGLLLGQRIQQRALGSDRNLPQAALLSTLLMIAVIIPLLISFRQRKANAPEVASE